jgi:hypothetical protein
MVPIGSIEAEIVDDDWGACNTRLTAQRAVQLELLARLQPEADVVVDRASGPKKVSYPRDSGENHPGLVAKNLVHRRDCNDARYQRYVTGYRPGRLGRRFSTGHESSGQRYQLALMASPAAYPIMSHQPHLPGNASVADQCRGEAVNRMLSFLSNAVKGIVPIAAAGMQLHARIPDRRVGGVSRFDTVSDCFLYGSTVQPLDAPAEGESDDVRNRRARLESG